ncbi:MAG: helix-turn-helix domain-containing protein [Acidobacteria bacterium]|nr:helix-turn-helix domain-containing protein [Acidobacteriota bacterium]
MHESFDQLVDRLLRGGFFLEEAVEILEKTLVTRALFQTGGNRSEASKLLGIHRNTLQKKIRDYNLEARGALRKPAQRAGTALKRARA